MDAFERSLRERLHDAGAELTAMPYAPGRALGEPRGVGSQRELRPLLAAVALALVVAVGGVVGGIGLHGRLNGRQPAPAVSPPPAAPSPQVSTPAASPSAEVVPTFHNVSAVWDSTDKQIVAYDGVSRSGGSDAVWTWQGAWVQRTQPHGGGLGGNGFLVDAPGLHGVAFLGSSFQLWLNGAVTPLPTPAAPDCMLPFQGAWDYEHNQMVVTFTDQCTGSSSPRPAETWTYDAHAWTRRADLPAARYPQLAWDPDDKAVVLYGAAPQDFAQVWTWTGTGWSRGPASRYSYPIPTGGAGWDKRKGGVVVWAPSDAGGPARAQQYKRGVYTEILQQGYPERVEAVIADTTHGRLLALGQAVIPARETPAPWRQSDPYYVMEWSGATWAPIIYEELSASN